MDLYEQQMKIYENKDTIQGTLAGIALLLLFILIGTWVYQKM